MMEVAQPQFLSPCSSGRRSSSFANSPEFEFWMVKNNSSGFLQPDNLLTADELFVDGVLLPLHRLQNQHSNPLPPCIPESPPEEPAPPNSAAFTAGPELASATNESTTASKRWRDIFRKSDKKKEVDNKVKEGEKKKDTSNTNKRRGNSQSGITTTSELNINIWPFSRSRSDGNGGSRNRPAGTRKVSSAPCSRSNSQGDSKSRKWMSSPSRGGVHLGRSSPVWQVRRSGLGAKSSSKTTTSGGGGKGKVLNLNVPMCIGYKQHLSCRSDESSVVGGGSRGGRGSGGSDKHIGCGNGGNVTTGGGGVTSFNLRSLFTKKVY